MAVHKLVLVRHGESVWNKENRFTGWTDVDLSERGISEAQQAGDMLNSEGYTFDLAYTSVLKRAVRTLWIILDKMDLMWIPVINSWRLNERHYGALQGLNKSETAAKYGQEIIAKWRRSYDIPPPELAKDDPRWPGADPRYSGLKESEVPLTESLKLTSGRFMPYWHNMIAPSVKSGKKVIVAAHGNSLRALVKHLNNIPDDEIAELNIPTGIPLVYEFDGNLNVLKHYYLGDKSKIQAAINEVANQANAAKGIVAAHSDAEVTIK